MAKAPHVPISIGELFDRISILEIKQSKVVSRLQRQHIEDELNKLLATLKALKLEEEFAFINSVIKQLYDVNALLWALEDRLRELEQERTFKAEFIALARLVYLANDLRTRLKQRINQEVHSPIWDMKIYSGGLTIIQNLDTNANQP